MEINSYEVMIIDSDLEECFAEYKKCFPNK